MNGLKGCGKKKIPNEISFSCKENVNLQGNGKEIILGDVTQGHKDKTICSLFTWLLAMNSSAAHRIWSVSRGQEDKKGHGRGK